MTPKFTIDTQALTSALELYVDELLITTYTYDNANFTLSERLTETLVTVAELNENIDAIRNWIVTLQRVGFALDQKFSIGRMALCGVDVDYKDTIRETNNHFKHDQLINDIPTLEIDFNKNTLVTSFQPRAALVLTQAEFVVYFNALARVQRRVNY